MKRNILIIAAVIISMTLNACNINVDGESFSGKSIKGNGQIVTQNYDMTAFTKISISLPATVNFTVSNDYTCTVRVDENLIEYLDIKVKNHELQMGKRQEHKNISLKATEFVIDVTAPSLENINLAGSGTFNVLSPLEAEEMEVNVAGSGDIFFNKMITVKKIEMNVAGSGNVECNALVADKLDGNVAGSGDMKIVSGTVGEATASVAGSGDFNLYCDIENLEANIAGSGDIAARVSGKLKYGIIGSGDIGYYGNPTLEGEKLGSGSVTRLGD